MGIIQKQSIRGTIFNYLGVVLGFITSAILFTRFLGKDQIGLINTLIAYTLLLSQIATLGFNSVTNRLFPHFRNDTNKHNSYSGLLFLIILVGGIAFILLFPVIKTVLVNSKDEGSALFYENFNLLIPLVIAYLLFSIFDNYLKAALYNATLGIFLREFLQRMLILVILVLFIIKLFTFEVFMLLYVSCIFIPPLVIIAHLIRKNQLTLRPDFGFISTNKLSREISTVGLYGILGGLSGMVIATVDKIMITEFVGLDGTGVYSIAFYFGTLVLIPSRSMLKIATTFIAEAWKKNDLKTIKEVYHKTCLNLFIVALFIFFLIWLNIDNIFQLITKEYESGKYVILIIALTNVIVMATGVNAIIISTSKHFRYETYFIISFGILVVLTNLLFIPRYGINGAAIASLVSGFVYALARILFVFVKFRLQPFNYKFLLIACFGVAGYLVSAFLPLKVHFAIDLLLRSAVFMVIFFHLLYIFKSSEDINKFVREYGSKLPMIKKWFN